MKDKFTILKITLLVIMLSLSFTTKSLSQVPTPCTPDCQNTPFLGPYLLINTDYPNCTLNIWYYCRHACNLYWDVQIVMIETVGDGCGVLQPLDQLFKRAYYKLIGTNPNPPMGFPPICPPGFNGMVCNEQWRISQASCWTTYEVIVTGQSHKVSIPCTGSEYCLQPMKICRDCPSGVVSITPLGDPGSYNNCSEAIPPIPPAPPGSHCELVCNWFLYHDEGITNPSNGNLNQNMPVNEGLNSGSRIMDEGLPVEIVAKEGGNYEIRITDVYGTILKEVKGALSIGYNKINVNLRDLKSANYVYSVIVNGMSFTTGKISLEK